jgi:large subunit ribosomal protein L23
MNKSLVPHITEKSYATISEEKGAVNQYTFKVPRTSSKADVKDQVEKAFDVHVEDVRIINLPRKARNYRGHRGFTKAIKKAVVRLKAGERIAAFATETETAPEAPAK